MDNVLLTIQAFVNKGFGTEIEIYVDKEEIGLHHIQTFLRKVYNIHIQITFADFTGTKYRTSVVFIDNKSAKRYAGEHKEYKEALAAGIDIALIYVEK